MTRTALLTLLVPIAIALAEGPSRPAEATPAAQAKTGIEKQIHTSPVGSLKSLEAFTVKDTRKLPQKAKLALEEFTKKPPITTGGEPGAFELNVNGHRVFLVTCYSSPYEVIKIKAFDDAGELLAEGQSAQGWVTWSR